MFQTDHSHKILVVEDENIIAMEIQSRLQKMGYDVPVILRTGAEAIAKAETLRPDLILMDITLKGEMDGIEATETILARYDIPVVYLTANTDEKTFQRAKITNPFGYILKPFDERTLHSAIEMAIYKAGTEKELRRYREDLEEMVADRIKELQTEMERHKETAQALHISEKNYRTIFDNANDAIFVQDCRTGAILDVNQKMTEIYGVSRKEACRLRVEDLSADNKPDTMAEAQRHMLLATEGTPQLFEWLAKNRGGQHFWVEVNLKCTNIGGKKCLLAVVRDITIRKQAEQALLKAKEAAESANRAKSEFLANMSHELHTPMNHILGMSAIALTTELTDKQRNYLQVINESGTALLGLLTNILDLSRIEAGQIKLNHNLFTLKKVVEHTVNSFREQAEKKGIEIKTNLSSQLPLSVTGDLIKLRQVIVNLIDNAIKFTQSGQILIEAHEEPTEKTGICIHFSITDTGIGIAREKHQTIFKVFSQGDGSTARNYGGTGLGLAIAKKLVEMMAGKIWFESKEGQGSTFCFSIMFNQY